MFYISAEKIKLMNKRGATIIVANEKVYDCALFANQHPGGKAIFTQAIAKYDTSEIDATRDYEFHSRNAKKIWEKSCIASLKKDDCVLM